MTLHLKSASYLADLDRHVRSFQKTGTEYGSIAKTCLLEYPGGNHIMGQIMPTKTEGFLIQYEETDWEFLKRLAAKSQALLLPDDVTGDVKLYFGIPNFGQVQEIDSDSYRIVKNMEGANKQRGNTTLRDEDLTVYEVEHREIYRVGTQVRFQGKVLYIGAMNSTLKGSELYHTYQLMTKNGLTAKRTINLKLTGSSTMATVTGVKQDKVTVEITADENKDKAGAKWFPFATIYSTPDGTGWYCMPEIGDQVRIYFPTQDEEEAYVESSVHLQEGISSRENPQEKSIMNCQKKEILFTPDSLILRNNNGMSVELLDNEGIKIISDKSIYIKAKETIQMNSSSGEIDMSAGSCIQMKQGSAQFKISDKITLTGGKINLN